MLNSLDFQSLARNILETENAVGELRVTDLITQSIHEKGNFSHELRVSIAALAQLRNSHYQARKSRSTRAREIKAELIHW